MIYLQFGYIGERISNEIPCTSARQAAVLAANIARVAGCFAENAETPNEWLLDRKTTKISWESAGKSYFCATDKEIIMLLTDQKLARLKAAGYTYYILYDKFLPICELWTRTGFPACDDSIAMHREALESGRMDDIRNVEVIKL